MILDLNYYERQGILKGSFLFLRNLGLFLISFFGIFAHRFRGRSRKKRRDPVKGRPFLTVTEKGELRCTSCGLCEKICPSSCISLVPQANQRAPLSFELDLLKCVFCGLCVEICPVDAIRMGDDLLMAGLQEQNWVLERHHLAFSPTLNEGKGMLSLVRDEDIQGF